jgi:hypothetical protein
MRPLKSAQPEKMMIQMPKNALALARQQAVAGSRSLNQGGGEGRMFESACAARLAANGPFHAAAGGSCPGAGPCAQNAWSVRSRTPDNRAKRSKVAALRSR